MKIALCQMENKGTIRENLEQSIRAIEEAALQKADLILFPEVQLTEFFPQYPGQDVSEYRVGQNSDIVKTFCNAARDNQIMVVPNLYLYQKMVHVAQANQFFEQDYYTPADDGFHVFDTEYGKIGIVVCFDRHYPESIRTEALMGADLILIPTVNTKAEPSEMFEWELRVQAFHNSVYIAMGNRVGTEGQMDFSGESIVIDANGNTIVKADDRAQILYTDIDLEQAKTIRNKRPYTNLRRTELYL